MESSIVKLERAQQMLMEAKSLDDILHVNDIAEAAVAYARAANLSTEACNTAAEVAILAKRKAGEYLAQLERNQGGDTKFGGSSNVGNTASEYQSAIEESNITYQDANRYQQVASVPEQRMQEVIQSIKDDRKELTTAGFLRLAKDVNNERKAERIPHHVENIEQPEEISFNVQAGSHWRCGRHIVHCQDSKKWKQLGTIITDPPYGISYDPSWDKWNGDKSEFTAIVGDTELFNPQPFLDNDNVVLFGANYYSDKLPVGGWICWDKRLDAIKDEMVGSPFELAWFKSVNTDKTSIMVRVLHGGVINADSEKGNNEKRLHPTQKPVILFEKIIEIVTAPDEVVIDPFAGSGTTLLACENTGRSCVAYEIVPEYVEIILRRFYSKTGIMPEVSYDWD